MFDVKSLRLEVQEFIINNQDELFASLTMNLNCQPRWASCVSIQLSRNSKVGLFQSQRSIVGVDVEGWKVVFEGGRRWLLVSLVKVVGLKAVWVGF